MQRSKRVFRCNGVGTQTLRSIRRLTSPTLALREWITENEVRAKEGAILLNEMAVRHKEEMSELRRTTHSLTDEDFENLHFLTSAAQYEPEEYDCLMSTGDYDHLLDYIAKMTGKKPETSGAPSFFDPTLLKGMLGYRWFIFAFYSRIIHRDRSNDENEWRNDTLLYIPALEREWGVGATPGGRSHRCDGNCERDDGFEFWVPF